MIFFAKNRYDFSHSISAIFSCAGASSQMTLICLHYLDRVGSSVLKLLLIFLPEKMVFWGRIVTIFYG